MSGNQCLSWEGCTNVRDLGGLRTRDGRVTRWGAVVRGDTPARLTALGWSALYAHGIRTIISLRTDGPEAILRQMPDERMPDTAPRPADLATIQAAIEDLGDTEFLKTWAATDLWSTPLYYPDALRRWPQRHAAAIRAVARARPGGVLFHCIRGHDRTGIIALLLLALAGVVPDDIVADYELSLDSERDALLAHRGTSPREVILATLAGLDVESYLRAGGLSEADWTAARARLLEGV